MRIRVFPLFVFVTILAGITPLAHADLALDLATAQSSAGCLGCGPAGTTVGWSFIVNSDITVDGIGVRDDTAARFGTPTEAGIFDDTGNLFASVAISSASTPVPSNK
jgi:hypothetical protein